MQYYKYHTDLEADKSSPLSVESFSRTYNNYLGIGNVEFKFKISVIMLEINFTYSRASFFKKLCYSLIAYKQVIQ